MLIVVEQIIHFFNLIGSLVCHQRPERTLIISEQYLPVCARDTGGYLGLLIGYIVLLFRRKEATGPPNLWATLMLSTPMIIDVSTQTLGVRESINSLRLLTGLFFGVSILPLLIYVIPLIPGIQRLPLFSLLAPSNPKLDDVRNPWITSRTLFFGALLCLIVFFTVEYATTSSNPYLYWVVTLPVIFSLMLHIFLLPLLILGVLTFKFISSYIGKR
jgi:uncharacterized membrane protein